MAVRKKVTKKKSTRKRVAPTVAAATERARDEDGQFVGDDPATPQNEAYSVKLAVKGEAGRRYAAMAKPVFKCFWGEYAGEVISTEVVVFLVEPEVATAFTANPKGPYYVYGGDS